MKYSNQQLPEGINTSTKHPLKIFFSLLALMLTALFVMALVLGWSGAWLAKLVPFEKERSLLSNVEVIQGYDSPMQDYLSELADDLLLRMDMQDEFSVTVNFSPQMQVSAFATLGGHLLIYKGLLKELQSENALVMLLAHELAHIKHRDPIASIGQGLAIETGLGMVLGQADIDILGNAGLYTRLKFNRDMESDADSEALAAVIDRYGHLDGALGLYKVLLEKSGKSNFLQPEFMRTHPLTNNRVTQLEDTAKEHNWRSSGEITPLPQRYRQWLKEASSQD